jgi:DNA invertase Pin-like site-specific DNA recombinase
LRIPIYFKNLNVLSLDEYGNESLVTNLIIAIYAEFAGEEVRLLSERVKSGLEKAKAQGKQLGRPSNSQESDEKLKRKYSKLIQDLKNGLSLNKCMKIHGVSKNTVIKVKRIIV